MSPAIRMYLPLERGQVAELQTQGRLEPGLESFGVTPALRASEPHGDDELWEFLALQQAAAYAQAHRPSIVLAAVDIEGDLLTQSTGEAVDSSPVGPVGRTSVPVTLKNLASLHLGDDALGDYSESPANDEPANDEPFDLSWFDSTEVAQVVRLLSAPQETSTWTQ